MQSYLLTSKRYLGPIVAIPILALIAGLFVSVSEAQSRSTSVSATLQSFKIKLKKKSAKRGTVIFRARNKRGRHNICIRGKGVRKCAKIVTTGKRTTLKVKLRKKGTYTVFCSVSNHEELGMKTKFKVR